MCAFAWMLTTYSFVFPLKSSLFFAWFDRMHSIGWNRTFTISCNVINETMNVKECFCVFFSISEFQCVAKDWISDFNNKKVKCKFARLIFRPQKKKLLPQSHRNTSIMNIISYLNKKKTKKKIMQKLMLQQHEVSELICKENKIKSKF